MASKKKAYKSIHRTDILPSNLTKSKELQIIDMIKAYRTGAPMIGAIQWKLFFEKGKINKFFDKYGPDILNAIGAANRVQMCSSQVVGILQSYLSNAANEFSNIVQKSTLSDDIKYMLNTINYHQAWYINQEIVMKKTDEIIPDEIRRLARLIMRQVFKRMKKPNLSKISMWLDSRAGSLSKPIKATQNGKVAHWIKMSTLIPKKIINVPLLGYDYHNSRKGIIANGIQVNLDKHGKLSFGVVTDIGEKCSVSRNEYKGEGIIGLDFGLKTIFATSEGQLLGQNFIKQLKKYDDLIQMISKKQQKQGKKPRDSKRYCKLVQKTRGLIKTEINRILNKLITNKQPTELVLEKLDFRNPNMSKQMNRLIQNCGRSVVKEKLIDLKDKFGIISIEVNPAYTSQTCSSPSCGYVDSRNRHGDKFKCLFCGLKLHADLNGSRNIKGRRASSIGSLFLRRGAVLVKLIERFNERYNGRRGVPADPRETNVYFGSSGGVILPKEEVKNDIHHFL